MERVIRNCVTGEEIHIKLSVEEIAEMEAANAQAEREYWKNIPYDEAVNDKIRERYSVSQEFAILRQRNEKPEEYAAYFAYCEECKQYVKVKKGLR